MTRTHTGFLSALASIILLLGACTPVVNQRGNMLGDQQIERVEVGKHSRSDVMRILGSPTTQGPFDSNTWYYIGQETEKRGILDPEVVEERIVIVAFDEKGVVESLKESDEGRIDLPIEDDSTPTHGNNLTFVQQMLGNLGRFNPQE